MENLTVGNDKQHVIIPTRLEEAKHFKSLAEGLQKMVIRLTLRGYTRGTFLFIEEPLVRGFC